MQTQSKSTPIQSIPIQSNPNEVKSIPILMQSIPIQSTTHRTRHGSRPGQSTPALLGTNQFQSNRIHAAPLHSIRIGSNQFQTSPPHSAPLHSQRNFVWPLLTHVPSCLHGFVFQSQYGAGSVQFLPDQREPVITGFSCGQVQEYPVLLSLTHLAALSRGFTK